MRYSLCNDLTKYDEPSLQRLFDSMPSERQQAYGQINNPQQRRNSMVAYDLLVQLLKAEGIFTVMPTFSIGRYGKPAMNEYPNMEFNLSHCRGGVAVALHNAPIGIDVECRRRVNDSLMTKVCNCNELSSLATSNDKELDFIRIWTRKEAYVKMTGKGIRCDLSQIELPLKDGTHRRKEQQTTLVSHHLPNLDGWLTLCYYDHPLTIRICRPSELPLLLELQETIFAQLPNPTLLRRNSEEMLAECLSAPHTVIGAYDEERLVAVAILYVPTNDAEELSHLLQDVDQYPRTTTANYKLALVDPHYRGRGLQVAMGRRLEQVAIQQGFRRLCTTVSPDNIASRTNIQHQGFYYNRTLQKYGYCRELWYKDIQL